MVPTGCPITSVTDYQPKLSNMPGERTPQLLRRENLKSRFMCNFKPFSQPYIVLKCSPCRRVLNTESNFKIYPANSII
jgi:hypothetical protein